MRLLIAASLCLISLPSQAQKSHARVAVNTIYMPQFTVRQATDRNLQITGIRTTFSNYDYAPVDFGIHVYAGYGDVAIGSFGFNLAYLFAERKSHYFKLGLSLSKIDLEDVRVEDEGIGPSVGDV